ncbi:helix-turn-helix transcriptional regulator [Trinickia sp. LjRoot230]|uniref:helix-turn-helix domain-containing protein n=1 Tax=Trinickia sp. LjRoot230 TaxID=3342288 RepID=UPI003ECCDAD6
MDTTLTTSAPRSPAAPAAPAAPTTSRTVGEMLREWRQRRRLSQLLLANEAQISTRHLSFVESGRALPSREMVMHLAERLDVPLRSRNALLVAAGYAPLYRERPLADPQLAAAREAVELVLRAHEPYPALAIDRHWTMIAANGAVAPLLARVAPSLLAAPVNVLRLSLHPQGLAPQIVNWAAWRAHILQRVERQAQTSGDGVLAALAEELAAYPAPSAEPSAKRHGANEASDALVHTTDIVVPLILRTEWGVLSFFSTTTVFGTPVDITLSELAIEAFFPADAETADALRAHASERAAQ